MKEIDIRTTRFELKENEKVYGYSNAGQASTTTKKVVIVKQRIVNCEKICRKAFNIFAFDN